MTNYLEMQPGTIWMQNKTRFNDATIIVKIETAPYCKIQPAYGFDKCRSDVPITEPPYEGAPIIKMFTYNRYPKMIVRYLICDSLKHLDKISLYHANGFTHTHTRIH